MTKWDASILLLLMTSDFFYLVRFSVFLLKRLQQWLSRVTEAEYIIIMIVFVVYWLVALNWIGLIERGKARFLRAASSFEYCAHHVTSQFLFFSAEKMFQWKRPWHDDNQHICVDAPLRHHQYLLPAPCMTLVLMAYGSFSGRRSGISGLWCTFSVGKTDPYRLPQNILATLYMPIIGVLHISGQPAVMYAFTSNSMLDAKYCCCCWILDFSMMWVER